MSSEVLITPSGSIRWRADEVDQGIMYLPLQKSETERTSLLLRQEDLGVSVGSGNSGGSVFLPKNENDRLIKQFVPSTASRDSICSNRGDLPTLRVNIMLSEGLELVEQNNNAWRIFGNRVLGVIVYDNERESTYGVSARWVLERVVSRADTLDYDFYPAKGKRKKNLLRPASRFPGLTLLERCELYDKALDAVNGEKVEARHCPAYDDHHQNLIITQKPRLRFKEVKRRGEVVKIDTNCRMGFDY